MDDSGLITRLLRQFGHGSTPAVNNGPSSRTIVFSLTAVGMGAVFHRWYMKRKRNWRWWWEDYLFLAAELCVLVTAVLVSLSIRDGFGKPSADVDPANFDGMAIRGVVVVTFVGLGSALSKTALAVQLVQAAQATARSVSIVSSAIVINMAMNAEMVLLSIQCMPFRRLWNPTAPDSCWTGAFNYKAALFTHASSGIIDFLLVASTIFVFHKAFTDLTELSIVATAVTFGLVASFSCLVRVIIYLTTLDMFYSACIMIVWNFVEVVFLMLAGSVLLPSRQWPQGLPKPPRPQPPDPGSIVLTRLDIPVYRAQHTTVVASTRRPPSAGFLERRGVDRSEAAHTVVREQEVVVEYEQREDWPTPERPTEVLERETEQRRCGS